MKALSFALGGAILLAGSLQCFAMPHGDGGHSPDLASPPGATTADLRTSDVDVWDLHKLKSQVVLSQGGTGRAGPRNRHVQGPHGGPVAVGNRSETQGRE
jgi:hypothetical protein